jgi:hypothetical protein
MSMIFMSEFIAVKETRTRVSLRHAKSCLTARPEHYSLMQKKEYMYMHFITIQ